MVEVPKTCANVDTKILMPNKTWADQAGTRRVPKKGMVFQRYVSSNIFKP